MKQKILVASYAKIILEFVSAFNFNLLSIYLYGKMVYLIAHRFLFFLVKPLATTIQHFPLSKTSTKTPVFLIKQYHALLIVSCMIFTCFPAKFSHLWLQNIAYSQLESSQQYKIVMYNSYKCPSLQIFGQTDSFFDI